MQYHRIPQNVTTYEGRIVGKFTARQFIYLAIGAIIDFILLGLTPVPASYRIVVGVIVSGIAAIFALVTYDGRSTDTWIVTFLRAVLRPTQRIWVKHETPPEFLMPGYHPPKPESGDRVRDPAELEGFLRRRAQTSEGDEFDSQERAALQRIAEIQAEKK